MFSQLSVNLLIEGLWCLASLRTITPPPLRTIPLELYTPWQYIPQQCTSPERQWDIVGKQAGCILLEWFLVDYILLIFPDQELLNRYRKFLK